MTHQQRIEAISYLREIADTFEIPRLKEIADGLENWQDEPPGLTVAQQQVRDWMRKAGQDCPAFPIIPEVEVCELRESLHQEEAVDELHQAFCEGDKVLIADSLADSLVVILGTAVACGIEIEPIFNEVMRSNMTKFIDGYRGPNGKWIKGPSYTPANIAPLIEAQAEIPICNECKS